MRQALVFATLLIAASLIVLALTSNEQNATAIGGSQPAEQNDAHAESTPGAAQSEVTNRSPATSSLDRRRLEGFVMFPQGSPRDPSLAVYASTASLPAEQRSDPTTLEQLPTASVAPDGSFAIDLPDRTASVEAWVSGAFLYSPLPIRVEFSNPVEVIELRPSLGAHISGTVIPPASRTAGKWSTATSVRLTLDELGASFDGGRRGRGAQVPSEQIATREVALATNGTFEFRAVAARVPVRVELIHVRLTTRQSKSLMLAPGEHREIRIETLEGATLAGRVIDEDGQPIIDGRVRVRGEREAFGQAGPGDILRDVRTDSSGRFNVPGLQPGALYIHAKQRGYLESRNRRFELEDGQHEAGLEIRLNRGKQLAGSVVWPDGTPATGATINAVKNTRSMAFGGSYRGATAKAIANARGEFELSGLGSGTFEVRAECEPTDPQRVRLATRWGVTMDAIALTKESLRLELKPITQLRGVVTTKSDEPVTEFSIEATRQLAALEEQTERASFADRSDGSFVLDLGAGVWSVRAVARGFQSQKPVRVTLPQAPDTEPVQIRLRRAVTARGLVVDPGGTPIEGAMVSVTRDLLSSLLGSRSDAATAATMTDSDGKFELTGIPPGRAQIVASHAEFAPSEPVACKGRPGDVVEIDLKLGLGGSLSGEVYGADGEPAAGAQVIAQTKGQSPVFIATDEHGEFELQRLTPGPYELHVTLRSTAARTGASRDDNATLARLYANMLTAAVEVLAGQHTHEVIGSPLQRTHRVRGSVVSGGSALASVLVEMSSRGFSSETYRTTTDASGRFELEVAQSGAYRVSARIVNGLLAGQRASYFAKTVSADGVTELSLELPAGSIRGTVRGPGGTPGANVRVSLCPDRGQAQRPSGCATTLTDASGTYRFDFLPPGTYEITAGGSDSAAILGSTSKLATARQSGIRVEADIETSGIDFDLVQGSELRGLVRDKSGNPIVATVFVRDTAGVLVHQLSPVQSNSTGEFVYRGLSRGSYTVFAKSNSRITAEEIRVAIGPEGGEVELIVAAGTVLTIDYGDSTEAQIVTSVRDKAGREVHGMMSTLAVVAGEPTPRHRVGPLAPGRYVVRGIRADGKQTQRTVDVRGQSDQTVQLRFDN